MINNVIAAIPTAIIAYVGSAVLFRIAFRKWPATTDWKFVCVGMAATMVMMH